MLKSLPSKLIAWMVTAALVPTLVLGGLNVLTSRNSATLNAESTLGAQANDAEILLTQTADKMLSLSRLLARAHALQTGTPAEISALLTEVRNNTAGIETIWVVDSQGMSAYNTAGARVDMARNPHTQSALRGESRLVLEASAADGATRLVGSAPIVDRRGQTVGGVVLYLNLARTPAVAGALLPFQATGEAYLVNRHGLFATASRFQERALGTTMASAATLQMFVADAPEVLFGRYTNYAGVEVFGAMSFIPVLGVVIVAEQHHAEVMAAVGAQNLQLAFVIAASILATSLLAWVMAAGIARRLQQILQSAEAVAGGNLAVIVAADRSGDEIGALSRAFVTMVKSLGELIRGAQSSAQEVAERAALVSGSIAEVAAGNNSQADITQEVIKALEQLAAATQEIAANAQHALAASAAAQQAAGDGAARIGKAIASLATVQENVTDLAKASQQIGGIVNTIESIADQTNLLALNAAIEAARAGEHGRGFAVVADAVRSLAQQSSESTQEISHLIRSIQEQIDVAVNVSTQGTAGARGAREALDNIVAKVNQIALMIEGISAAGEEQSGSANEVAASMQNLGAITEEVAASSQETAAASAQLAELGRRLDQAASRFKV